MFSKSSMKSIPLAAAMTAALMFGAVAHAQTPMGAAATGGDSSAPMSKSTKPAVNSGMAAPAAPMARGDAAPAEAKTAMKPAMTSGMAAPAAAPMARGDSAPAEAKAAMTPEQRQMKAEQRAMAKANKKSTRAAKRAARKAKNMDGTARSNSDSGTQPVSGLGAVSPTPAK